MDAQHQAGVVRKGTVIRNPIIVKSCVQPNVHGSGMTNSASSLKDN
jgi:hypothetical protein